MRTWQHFNVIFRLSSTARLLLFVPIVSHSFLPLSIHFSSLCVSPNERDGSIGQISSDQVQNRRLDGAISSGASRALRAIVRAYIFQCVGYRFKFTTASARRPKACDAARILLGVYRLMVFHLCIHTFLSLSSAYSPIRGGCPPRVSNVFSSCSFFRCLLAFTLPPFLSLALAHTFLVVSLAASSARGITIPSRRCSR